MDEAVDTTRTTVKTYVPTYQKEEWKSHADELDMSQSEFIRTMVQAGRQGFDSPISKETTPPETDTPSPGTDPGGNGLETQVLKLLADDTYSWDELLEAVSNDIESRLDAAVTHLQEENQIRYSGRHGGYTRIGDDHGN